VLKGKLKLFPPCARSPFVPFFCGKGNPKGGKKAKLKVLQRKTFSGKNCREKTGALEKFKSFLGFPLKI